MNSEGQRWAFGQLNDLVKASSGSLEIVDVSEPSKEGDELVVTLSVDCSGYDHEPGGLRLRARERLILKVAQHFPLDIPRLYFSHNRFADSAHVQWGSYICLYQAPDTEWQPEDGLFGYFQRVHDWLRAAAAKALDPVGMPLHPPVAYTAAELKIVPTHNAPAVEGPFWAGYAEITKQSDLRAELGRWIPYNDDEIAGNDLAAVVLLPTGMPHEYPTAMASLLDTLEARFVSRDVVRLITELAAMRSAKGKPILFVLGALMRGIVGGERLQHLTCWRIDAERADAIRNEIDAATDDSPLNVEGFTKWAASAPIEWCSVLEDRPEIVSRRDAGSPAEYWRGRHVVLLGCGAIGSEVAMLLARAGVSKLVLYDRDIVKPGVLVRQHFDRSQIGMNKAKAAAQNAKYANPSVEALSSGANIVHLLRNPDRLAELREADVIINATASTVVATALEQVLGRSPKKHPPLISMVLGHQADQALMTYADEAVPGVTLDIDRRVKIAVAGLGHAKHVLEEFWPVSVDRNRLFQPEPGCSNPTFRGSGADVIALTARMTNAAAEWLKRPGRGVARARSFDMTAQRHTGALREFEFEWPPDVVLPDGRNGYSIRLSQPVIAGLRTWMRRSERVIGSRSETGGLLFGHVDDHLKIVWVDEISGPPPDSIQSPEEFLCGVEGINELNSEKLKRTRNSVGFVGMWHTHPNGIPVPSRTDLGAMRQLLKGDNFEAKRFLMVIAGADSSRPLISGTVFDRSDYGQ